jgi:hypothetical protein
MNFGQIAPWENYPKYLNFKEIQNPLLVLDEFFGDWVEIHSSELKKWKKYALSSKVYRGEVHGPGELVFIYDRNIRLLEACYLLLCNYKYTYGKRNKVTDAILEKGKQEWAFFPDDLSESELLDPYKRIKKTFKRASLEAYRENLKEWLLFALYTLPIDEGELSISMTNIYENMCKLYSAAWIINQVEGTDPRLNDEYPNSLTPLGKLILEANHSAPSTEDDSKASDGAAED